MPWFLAIAQPAGGSQNPLAALLPIVLIVGVFYFLLIRPQQKRAKTHRSMLEALKAGDSVVTIGGLHGTVVGIESDTVFVRVADNVKVKLNKSAIAGVMTAKE